MKKPKTNFNSHAAGIISQAEQPAQEPTTRGKITTFEIAHDLDKQLTRVAFWGGPEETKRNVINTALAYYFANDPEAKAHAATPVPKEK